MESCGGIHDDENDSAIPTGVITPQSESTKGNTTPIEEGDKAERGEAPVPMENLQQPETGPRRRSFRHPEQEAIELDSIRYAIRSRRSLSVEEE
jgi:hypothetical protein